DRAGEPALAAHPDRLCGRLRLRLLPRDDRRPVLRAAMIGIDDLAALMPMLLPALGGVWILLIVALAQDRDIRWPALHAVLFLILSGASAISVLIHGRPGELFDGAVLIDAPALAFHLIFVVVALLTVLTSASHLRAEGYEFGEFYALSLVPV